MAQKSREIAEKILSAIGGSSNLVSATHCMTRLRLVLENQELVDMDKLKSVKGVMGINIVGEQYQIIIGNTVGNVYREFVAVSGIDENKSKDHGDSEKTNKNPVMVCLDFIAGSITPLINAIIAGGLIKVLLVILGPTLLGVLNSTSDTYILLNALGDAPFYFLPVLVAYTSSKKLNCNTFLSVMVSSILIYPDVITLLGSDKATHLFGMIPVVHGSYASSIIPAILSTLFLKYVEIFVNKICPEWAKNFLQPMLIVLITAPVTICLFAPLGLIVGNGLYMIVNNVYGFAPWLALAFYGGALPFFVMTGMHWAFVPAVLLGLGGVGYDVLQLPAMLSANVAQAGAAFGAGLKTKDKDMKEVAIPAAIACFVSGVTEPAMYGVNLKLKKPMIAACIAGAAGGFVSGLVRLKSYAFAVPSLTSLVQFVAPDNNKNFIFAIAIFVGVLLLSFVLSFVLTEDEDNIKGNQKETCQEIVSPIKGEIIKLSDVKDETFASGVLGKGFAVIPSEGKVYAPFDGKCQALFPTLHALGLVSDDGIELMIHVGLETVTLNGKPFTAHIKDGEKFKKGDLLLEFNMNEILEAGCEIQTPVIITNKEDVKVEKNRLVIGG